jgi:hypothetical protein
VLNLSSSLIIWLLREQIIFDEFAEYNPESILPTELDLESDMKVVDKADGDISKNKSHVPSFKDDASPPLWTEVVRKGKAKSRSNRIKYDDRRVLEY